MGLLLWAMEGLLLWVMAELLFHLVPALAHHRQTVLSLLALLVRLVLQGLLHLQAECPEAHHHHLVVVEVPLLRVDRVLHQLVEHLRLVAEEAEPEEEHHHHLLEVAAHSGNLSSYNPIHLQHLLR